MCVLLTGCSFDQCCLTLTCRQLRLYWEGEADHIFTTTSRLVMIKRWRRTKQRLVTAVWKCSKMDCWKESNEHHKGNLPYYHPYTMNVHIMVVPDHLTAASKFHPGLVATCTTRLFRS